MSNQFHTLRVVSVLEETPDAIVVTLEPTIESEIDEFRFEAGQHLTLRAELEGEDIRRNYSLCSAPGDRCLRIGIKQIPGGRFSNWAASNLKAGDLIASMSPRGRFTWQFEAIAQRHYIAFAGGSGITPILSLLKTALAIEKMSSFTLFYGNRDSTSIMFLEELAALKDRYLERLRVYHFLEHEDGGVEFLHGRLDEERALDALDRFVSIKAVDAAFICGPGPMMDGAERALLAKGLEPDRLLIERFTASTAAAQIKPHTQRPTPTESGLRYDVIIDGRRRSVPFNVEHGNLLDSARAAGLPAPFACKAGVCATCRARLQSGSVEMPVNYGLTKEEIAEGYILTCQSFPKGEGVVIDFDA